MFTQLGWGKEPAYAAAGPTGMAAGFSRSNTYGLLQVEWQPAPGVDCPSNQPIAACTLTPEQMLYTITLNLAYLQPGLQY
jgi:hypothetical protein